MNPANLSDKELLRLYDDVFRQHPAVVELANRFGDGQTLAEDERDELRGEVDEVRRELKVARDRVDDLEIALDEVLDTADEDREAAIERASKILAEGR